MFRYHVLCHYLIARFLYSIRSTGPQGRGFYRVSTACPPLVLHLDPASADVLELLGMSASPYWPPSCGEAGNRTLANSEIGRASPVDLGTLALLKSHPSLPRRGQTPLLGLPSPGRQRPERGSEWQVTTIQVLIPRSPPATWVICSSSRSEVETSLPRPHQSYN